MQVNIMALVLCGVVGSGYANVVSIDDANAVRIKIKTTGTDPSLAQLYPLNARTFGQKSRYKDLR